MGSTNPGTLEGHSLAGWGQDRGWPVTAGASAVLSPCSDPDTAGTTQDPPSTGLGADGGVGCNANIGLYKCKSILYKPILSANHLYLEHLFLLETLKPCYIRACLNPLA